MVLNCVAVGCRNYRGKKEGLSFHRFPADPDRKEKWISAMRRADTFNTKKTWRPAPTSRICNEHFVEGVISNDPTSPNYIPTIFAHIPSPKKQQAIKALENHKRRKQLGQMRRDRQHKSDAAKALLSLSSPQEILSVSCSLSQHENMETAVTACCAEDSEGCNIVSNTSNMESVVADNIALREENRLLKEKLSSLSLDVDILKDDNKVKCLTGLQSGELFKILFEETEEFLCANSSVTKFKQLLMTFMRIRMNSSLQYLGYIFGIHRSTVSRIFKNVINVLYAVVVPMLVFWPERDVLRKTLPMSFRKVFANCACIIDCFEVFIERPSDLRARAETFSTYKNHNTMKYLIGITPQGTVSFISKGWGGRTSDKYITENSGFLDKILPGDVILADRGFTVQESIALHMAELHIPAFTKGKNQLSAIDVETTRRLASQRIHVERVIGVVRQKYTMLQGIIPITLLQSEDKVTTLDKIVAIACALCNMCESVVPFE